uniref:(northern house mosquito) hypothetical protein n=1 Tax=Culex pipiens TaxID=7175 RepID=A0A8D8IEK6_CULPI
MPAAVKRHRPEALAVSPAGRIRWDRWSDLRPTETNGPAGTTGDTRGSGRTRELGRTTPTPGTCACPAGRTCSSCSSDSTRTASAITRRRSTFATGSDRPRQSSPTSDFWDKPAAAPQSICP